MRRDSTGCFRGVQCGNLACFDREETRRALKLAKGQGLQTLALVVQLLAMEIAIRLGTDVAMPRNLAKSVTVE